MMEQDPSRQWFVYYKNKEMGPFLESEFRTKIERGEFDDSAHVFTEGMSDWTLLPEVPVLASEIDIEEPVKEVVQEAVQDHEEGTTESLGQLPDADPANQLEVSESVTESGSGEPPKDEVNVDVDSQPAAAVENKTVAKRRTPIIRSLKWLLPILVLVSGLFASKNYWLSPLTKLLNSQKLTGLFSPNGAASSSSQDHESLDENEASDPTSLSGAGTDRAIWKTLDEFVKIKNIKGAPFRLNTQHLGGRRPILVGAVFRAS